MHAKSEQIVRVRIFSMGFEDSAERTTRRLKRRVSKKVKTKTSTKLAYPCRFETKKKRPRDAKRHANANISMRPYVVRDPAEGMSFLSS
jgi:hypothetical protein